MNMTIAKTTCATKFIFYSPGSMSKSVNQIHLLTCESLIPNLGHSTPFEVLIFGANQNCFRLKASLHPEFGFSSYKSKTQENSQVLRGSAD
jgi:hypothetical protein